MNTSVISMKARLTFLPDIGRIRFRCCRDTTPKTGCRHHNLNFAKIFGYGDNIENRIDGQSLLADQGRLLALFRTTPMLNSPKIRHTFLTRDGSTTIAVESLLLNPRNYSRLDPLSEKHSKPGFSFVGTHEVNRD